MIQLRVTCYIWLLLSAYEFAPSAYGLIRDSFNHEFDGPIQADAFDAGFLSRAVLGSVGVLRHRAWGRVVPCFAVIILLLFTASYFLMVGPRFGMELLIADLVAAIFVIYSLIILFKFGRRV